MPPRVAAVVALAIGLFVFAPAATADKPVKAQILNTPLLLTGVCDFPVAGEPVGPQDQKGIVFSDGRTIFNGQLTIRVWNADDPSKAWEGTASGPVFLLPQDDGSLIVHGTGVNLWYFFAGNLGAGKPGALFLVKGLSTERLDANGNVVTGSFTHDGYIQDLCTTLA